MNSMYFNEEQVDSGEMIEFLNILLKQCYGKSEDYNDIHIKPVDCHAFIIEWNQIPWSGEYGGHFQFIEEDQTVMIEKFFPDNHSEMCYDEDDYKERLNDFLKNNPGWVKTAYETWTNELENKAFNDYLKEHTIKFSDEDAQGKCCDKDGENNE